MNNSPLTPLIEARQLVRVFKSAGNVSTVALAGASLKVYAGEFVALLGPSGSGKSTFLQLLGGLDQPTSGEIWIGKSPLHAMKEREISRLRRREIGFIFQAFHLLPGLSVLENVAFPLLADGISLKDATAESTQLIQQVGLAHRIHHDATELSGGEKQRVAIARALVTRPKVVLADEPTGSLDSANSLKILDLIQTLAQERKQTLILVTHDETAARRANRIVRFRDGKIESNSPQVLVRGLVTPPPFKSRMNVI